MEKGNLSINSENILPIIKKWLYSDMDIFLRELISNSSDAINKLKKLKDLGDAHHIDENEKYAIKVILDEKNKTITISDNGIGMSEDEIKKYINQIAFSGAGDFIEKYQERIGDGDNIIGHFGLGFYSAFMVADTVEIDSLSYAENTLPTHWASDGGIEYEISEGSRTARGTDVILHISDEAKEFLSEYKLKEIIRKYCSFMPVEIYFEKIMPEKSDAESDDSAEAVLPESKPINDTKPLWLKAASDCSDEEYKEFYHKVFMDFEDPLFWIHLNMDYPFRLRGILYFPKLKKQYETIEGQIKLYCNQVFVADNVKEVIPEFLLLLKGTLDCPDIPLNVSRSFLQNDGNVAKMSAYITRKVADKLNSLYKKDEEEYCKYWADINVFIKYGCIREQTFYEKIENAVVYKTINGEYKNIEELKDSKDENEEKNIYYVSDPAIQSQYINLFKESGQDAVILDHPIDNAFISYVEAFAKGVKFQRIDSDISEALKEDFEGDSNNGNLAELFKEHLNNDKLTIDAQGLKNENIPAIIIVSEYSRRMKEMSKMYAGGRADFPMEETLVINKNNPLVKLLSKLAANEDNKNDVALIMNQIYDLAQLSQKALDPEEMTLFIERSNKVLSLVAHSRLD